MSGTASPKAAEETRASQPLSLFGSIEATWNPPSSPTAVAPSVTSHASASEISPGLSLTRAPSGGQAVSTSASPSPKAPALIPPTTPSSSSTSPSHSATMAFSPGAAAPGGPQRNTESKQDAHQAPPLPPHAPASTSSSASLSSSLGGKDNTDDDDDSALEAKAIAEADELIRKFKITEDSLPVLPPGQKRKLLKRGSVQRQARFKTVPRELILFSDCIALGALPDSERDRAAGIIELKQVLPLADVTVDTRAASSTKLGNAFLVACADRVFPLGVATPAEMLTWQHAVAVAALAERRRRGQQQRQQQQQQQQQQQPYSTTTTTTAASSSSSSSDAGTQGSEATPFEDLDVNRILKGTLHNAVTEDDLERTTELLQVAKADPDERDIFGRSALHIGVLLDRAAHCAMLLDAGADANVSDRDGLTPVHHAARAGKIMLLKLLLFHGGSAEQPTSEGLTPLALACASSGVFAPDCVTALVDAKADPDSRNHAGRTHLMTCAFRGRTEPAQALIKAGASLSPICSDGRSALHYAASASWAQMALLLLSFGAAPNARDNNSATPLHLAGEIAVAHALLSHGARPDLTDSGGRLATHRFLAGPDRVPPPSFAKAAGMWQTLGPVPTKITGGGESTWLNDDASDVCLLCGVAFSFTRRRHHCRRCGMLVCASCSSKQFKDPPSGTLSRACDCCFNLIRGNISRAAAAASPSRSITMPPRSSPSTSPSPSPSPMPSSSPSPSAASASFVGGPGNSSSRRRSSNKGGSDDEGDDDDDDNRGSSSSDLAMPERPDLPPVLGPDARLPGAERRLHEKAVAEIKSDIAKMKQGDTVIHRRVEAAKATMHENRRLAEERAERLNEMADKSDRLEDRAKNFAAMAQKLKDQQKNSWF